MPVSPEEKRKQNLLDAMVLLEDIKSKPTPDFAAIWADLTDAQVEDEVSYLAHVHEWLQLNQD